MTVSRYQVLYDERCKLQGELETIASKAERTEAEGARCEELLASLEKLDPEIAQEKRIRDAIVQGPSAPVGERISRVHDREGDRPYGLSTFGITLGEFCQQYPTGFTVQGKRRDAREVYTEGALGEYLQEVASAGMPGGHISPRLLAGPSGASEGVPSDGGFLVRHEMSNMLLDRAVEAAVLAPLCLPVEIGADSDGIDLPYVDETSRANGSRWGGVQVYWRAEADTVTATKPKFGEFDLRLQELMGIAYATDRLLKDARALASIFSIAFSSEMAFKLDDAIFRGNGAGLPLGITDSTGPRVEQAKETAQAADTIVHDNLSKMWTRVLPRSKGRGLWLINSEVTPQLDKLAISVGTGGIEPRIVSYNDAGIVRIKGRPVMEIEQCAALGDAGDIVFADFSEYLLIRKGGIQADQSMHVRFLYGENTYRWTYRVNGRPLLKSAVTPYKTNTSNTQSAFVTLAARA